MISMQRRMITSVILLLAVLAPPGFCSDRFSFDGYHKNFFVAYKLPSINVLGTNLDLPPIGSVSSRLRLNCRWKLQRNISFALSYDLAPRVQDPILFDNPASARFIDPLSYRFGDLDSRFYPSIDDEVSSFAVFQNLDRAFLEIRVRSSTSLSRAATARAKSAGVSAHR